MARWIVLADPAGPQIGTGGATMHALCMASRALGAGISTSRILILHCGGMSQRVPQLAHVGKAFAPGCNGENATLFAQALRSLTDLFREMEPGVAIACGDVLYNAPQFHHPFLRGEAVGVACGASREQAARHGVYLWDDIEQTLEKSLQKPSVSSLQSLSEDQSWGLDTGILYFGAGIVSPLVRSVCANDQADPLPSFLQRSHEWQGVELYRDLTPPLSQSWNAGARLAGAPGDAQDALSQYRMSILCPRPASFTHFGTNLELLAILSSAPGYRVFDSYVTRGDLAPFAVVDRCLIENPIAVGSGSYVSGLNRPAHSLNIGSDRIVYQLPVSSTTLGSNHEALVAIGARDDARLHPTDGATLLHEPIEAWLSEMNLSHDQVWHGIPDRERCLWNARLFPHAEASAVSSDVPWLTDGEDPRFGQTADRWRGLPRISMGEASRHFDAQRWWAHEKRISKYSFAAKLARAIRDRNLETIRSLLADDAISPTSRRIACRELQRIADDPQIGHALDDARAWMIAAALSASKANVPLKLRERGLRCIRDAIVMGMGMHTGEAASPHKLHWSVEVGSSVVASAPVRVDIAGGWTDTPPQACERGGSVLNIALQLGGVVPLTARVERIREPIIELVSEDLGVTRVIKEAPSTLRRTDPRDPFGIHIAALTHLGMFASAPLRGLLCDLGGGIRLTTTANVPKGSGLGASSILAAAVMSALLAAFGKDWTLDSLCVDVLCLEQIMGTGGGWQDQVGGLWGGAKFATSEPGMRQSPQVTSVELSSDVQEGLAERMVLFYTGEPRLAKDVLQRVVGNYLIGQSATLQALDEMPGLARRAMRDLSSGDWDSLGACLDRSRYLNQTLEPTSSNANLDALFERISPFVLGAKLSGAGGGGFLFALARNKEAKAELCALLGDSSPPARIYSCSLDQAGLQVVRG